MLAVMERENPTPLQAYTPASMGRAGSQTGPVQDSSLQWATLASDHDMEDLYLCEMAGTSSLSEIIKLQAVINTTTSTVSHLGAKLPNLQELNLNGSVIESLRDLGSRFQSLSVLWVSRCGLSSLDGISGMPGLKELYCAYNDLDDVQPLTACMQLEVLDLEGNCIADTDSLGHLAGCTALHSLTITGNPAATPPNFAQQIAALLPGLQYLNDEPVHQVLAAADAAGACEPWHSGKTGQHISRSENSQQAHSSHSSSEQAVDATCTQSHAGEGLSIGATTQAGAVCELGLILQGIKHARVGFDSHEYQEFEGSMLTQETDPLPAAPHASQQHRLSTPPDAWPASPPLTAASSTESAVRQLPACATVMPSTPGAWLRTMQSVACGAIADLRASKEGSLQGPMSGTPPGLESSTAALSPCASRPSTSSTGTPRDSLSSCSQRAGPQRPSSALHPPSHPVGQAVGLQQLRPGSALGTARPYSARPGTAGSFRPGTSASMPSSTTATGGLYWRKHRINATGATLAWAAEQEAGQGEHEAGEDGVGGSSTLTFGGGAIGGSLARDLRRRKATNSNKPATAPAGVPSAPGVRSSAPCGLHNAAGQQPGSGSTDVSQAPGSTIYDAQQLLEELRRWKLETADRACSVGDGDGKGSGADQLWDGCDSAAVSVGGHTATITHEVGHSQKLAMKGAAGQTDILDLSADRNSSVTGAMLAAAYQQSFPRAHTTPDCSARPPPSAKPQPEVNLGVEGVCRTSERSSSSRRRKPDLQSTLSTDDTCARSHDRSSIQHASSRDHTALHHMSSVSRQAVAAEGIQPGVQNSIRQLPSSGKQRHGNRTVLCKVVRDAVSGSNTQQQQQQQQQSEEQPAAVHSRVKAQRTSATGNASMGAVAPISAHTALHTPGKLVRPSAQHSQVQYPAAEERISPNTRLSSTSRILHSSGVLEMRLSSKDQHLAAAQPGPKACLVASFAGEVDMTGVNPRPARRDSNDD